MKRVTILFAEFMAGIAGNLIAGWIQRDIFSDLFTPLRIISTLIGVITMVLLIAWLEKPEKSTRTNILLKAGTSRSMELDVQTSNQSYDVFISHASEDKDSFVRPLAVALREAGYRVWYDEFSLEIGDSLRESIDNGLAQSRFGLVVLSKAFFNKNWTVNELNGLFARQMQGSKVILPIWYNIAKSEVLQYSPMLADRLAFSSKDMSLEEIVVKLSKVLKIETHVGVYVK